MPTIAQVYRKSDPNVGQATFAEKLDLVPALLSIVGTVFWQMFSGPFRGEQGTDTYKHHISHAAVRKFTKRLATPQIHYLAPPLRTLYEQYCKTNSVPPNIVTLKSGTQAFWIGSPSAKNVVLYFHGGGFSMDGGAEHLNFWGGDVAKSLNASSPDSIAFLFLAYTLVPYATYPTQIREAVELLDYVVDDLKRSPDTISLGGDSAGGNLCLAVLSHLLHPHPDLPPPRLEAPLKSLVLVAPWTSFRVDFPSARTNADRDIVTTDIASLWSSAYMNGTASTPYAEALAADPDWWRGAENKVTQIVCVAGSDELLLDAISQWVEKYQSVTPKNHLELVIGHREIHIAPIIEPFLGDTIPTQQGEAIKAFLKARL